MTSRPLIGIVAHRSVVQEDGDTITRHVTNTAYVKAVRRAGGAPVLMPLVEVSDVGELLERLDGIVLPGGNDVDPARYGQEPSVHLGRVDPERDELELALTAAVTRSRRPTLAICRGAQLLNVALGGTLVQHQEDHFHPEQANVEVHRVEVAPGSTLSRWLGRPGGGELAVNSIHHQSVDRLADGLVVSARASDGTVEAVEPDGMPWVLGVQWHPETLRHLPAHLGLFGHLVSLAGR